MPWPEENEAVPCDVCGKKVRWVGNDGPNYTVYDGPPNEPNVVLVCKPCEVLMDHFGFSTYAMKRYLDHEKRIQAKA